MIAGIFDRIFKRKQQPEVEEELDQHVVPPSESTEGTLEPWHDSAGYQKGLSDLEMDANILSKFDGIEYQLKLYNKSIEMIGDITVNLQSQKKLIADIPKPTNLVEMLASRKSVIMKFNIQPKFTIGKTGVYGKIEYFDFKSKERKIFRLPQMYIDFVVRELKPKRVNEDEWRQICSGLESYDVETKVMEIAPSKLFKIFYEVTDRTGLFMLPLIENVNLYRGIARFYGFDDDGHNYAVEIQIIGDKKNSKVLFRVWSVKAENAMGLAFNILDTINEVMKIKKFIVEK